MSVSGSVSLSAVSVSVSASSLVRPAWVALAWLAAMTALATAGVFVPEPYGSPVALGVAAALPPLLAVAAMTGSDRARAWVAGLDLRVLTLLQMWRVAGFAFLPLWVSGVIPGRFALPAGLGDVAVALTAPLVAFGLVGRSVGWFRAWTVFGIADLVLAVTLGVLHSWSPIGALTGTGPDTQPVTELPLVLIPTFGVPFCLVLHVLSLAHPAQRDQLSRGPAASPR